jgi:excisionase family DNA binding protein
MKPESKRKSAVLTVKQFADRFGVSRQHVFNLIEAGQLQAVNIGIGTLQFWRIPVAAADRYEAERLNVPAAQAVTTRKPDLGGNKP